MKFRISSTRIVDISKICDAYWVSEAPATLLVQWDSGDNEEFGGSEAVALWNVLQDNAPIAYEV